MISRQGAFLFFRRLGVKSRRLAEGLESGQYRSAFRGQGVEFKEVRPYQWGDDLRQMDWNVTARMGTPYVKDLIEERELTQIAVIDTSPSMEFGTKRMLKSELCEEIAWLLAFLAMSHGDRFATALFGGRKAAFFPPRKGEKEILSGFKKMQAAPRGKSSLEDALMMLSRLLKRRSHLFILSDFFFPLPEKALKLLSVRHEVFAFVVSDPAEWELPDCGPILLQDQETGETLLVDAASEKIRSAYKERRKEHYSVLQESFKRSGIRSAFFSTARIPAEDMIGFLRRLAHAR